MVVFVLYDVGMEVFGDVVDGLVVGIEVGVVDVFVVFDDVV